MNTQGTEREYKLDFKCFSVCLFSREMTHLTLQLALRLVPNTKEHSVKPRYERWSEVSSVRYV
jgi:hypothetical protein